MGKKFTNAASESVAPQVAAKSAAIPVPAPAAKTSAPRNSPVPKSAPAIAIKKEITHDMIARRAFEISAGGTGGDEMHNWLRAERELRGM